MAEKVILDKEEVSTLQGFQSQYRILTSQYGELFFQKKLIDSDMKSIDDEMTKLEENRISYMTKLQEKYGLGMIDINTGEFNPQT